MRLITDINLILYIGNLNLREALLLQMRKPNLREVKELVCGPPGKK